MTLVLKKLAVTVARTPVVAGVDLVLKSGEVTAVMGPNGSGKSSLANALAGHPKYTVTAGKIMLDGTDVTSLAADKRSRAGLFLSMQHPPAINGVSVANFLRTALGAQLGTPQNPQEFYKKLVAQLEHLKMSTDFAKRHVHVGFSGGEKKRLEVLQLLMLKPKYAVLDEIDSGLDVDALKIVATGILEATKAGTGVLLITHYNRLLKYVVPHVVHIMSAGKIIKTGGPELAVAVEKNGYAQFI